MTNSIGSIGNSYSSAAASTQTQRPPRRPEAEQMAAQLFSKLDTAGQGFIEKTDLQNAFSKISGSNTSNNSNGADALFSALDRDGNGKVTKQEFSDTLRQVAEQLDQQFMQSKIGNTADGADGVQGANRPPPPPHGPPPSGDKGGFSKDELSAAAEATQSSNNAVSSTLSNLVSNFDAADTNGDGKISAQEALAYQSSGSDNSQFDQRLLQQIGDLMQAYQIGAAESKSTSFSASA